MTLQASHISLKVNLKYDLITATEGPQKLKVKFDVVNMTHDIPERYLKFSMEGNTAATILNKAADLAKKLFVDKLVEQMTKSIEDLLKNNLPNILDQAMQKDGVYAGVLGIIGAKGQG